MEILERNKLRSTILVFVFIQMSATVNCPFFFFWLDTFRYLMSSTHINFNERMK